MIKLPVHLKEHGAADPPEDLHYLVARNGIFLVRKTLLFASATRVDSIPGLADQEPDIELRFPKVPRLTLEKIYGFFHAVYERWGGEAVVFLFYAPGHERFGLGVPPQIIEGSRVRYHLRPQPCPKGIFKLGDAHSHGDLPAFSSSTDDRDEAHEDGLRIVIGNLHRKRPDVSVSFVSHGTRFHLDRVDVLEDFSTPLLPPDAWLRKVSREKSNGAGRARARA